MLSFLPRPVRFMLSFTLFGINTVVACTLLVVVSIGKKIGLATLMVKIAESWIAINGLNMRLFQNIDWQIQGERDLSLKKSYLVISNHQSWVDIVAIQKVFNRRIPFLRFFLKQQLIWVPFLNMAWVALDFPFMKRYTKEEIAKHPEKKGKDLETTRRACEKFRGKAISILNFLEGTRWTPGKHKQQKSPFQYLLSPKTGGVAFVLGAMGEQFDAILDVTIRYPQGPVTMFNLFAGDIKCIQVHIQKILIPSEVLKAAKTYQEDKSSREQVQTWISQLWAEKDELLAQMSGNG